MTVTCENPQCPEAGVDKDMSLTLRPGETVRCGQCGTVIYTEPPGPGPR